MSGQMSSYKQIEASDNDTCLKAKRAREIVVRLNAIKKVNENAEKENVRKSELAHTKEMMLKAEIWTLWQKISYWANEKEAEINHRQEQIMQSVFELDRVNEQIIESKQVLQEYEYEIIRKKELNRYCNQLSNKFSVDDVTKVVEVI
jgi:hypothetical protein